MRDRVGAESQLGGAVAATGTDKVREHEPGRAARDVHRSAAGKVEVAELGERPAAAGTSESASARFAARRVAKCSATHSGLQTQ